MLDMWWLQHTVSSLSIPRYSLDTRRTYCTHTFIFADPDQAVFLNADPDPAETNMLIPLWRVFFSWKKIAKKLETMELV